jgi:hypothetical protein
MADAGTIQARWTLTFGRLAMPHMPATGVSGLDLYVKAVDGQWRWLGAAQLVLDCPLCSRPVPYQGNSPDGSQTMVECDRCNVFFDFDDREAHPIKASRMSG